MTNNQVILSLTLAISFAGAHAATITFTNSCPYTVWPGSLTADQQPQLSSIVTWHVGAHAATITCTNSCPYTVWSGSLTADQQPQLFSTGFELASGASSSLTTPVPWKGRFWGRTGCSTDASGKFSCATAECSSGQVACNGNGAVPPASLVEINIPANGGQDFYDVSLVDGFNLPVSVAPQGGTGDCQTSSCPANVNAACPAELQVKGSDGSVIACNSACTQFNQPQYCCTPPYETADKCPPTNYSEIFEKQCPQAYSYAYDDPNSTFTCSGGPNYVITFCPSA